MSNDVINRALRWARAQGMNQSAFAAKIGALPQHITNWKRRGVPTDQYQVIAEALGRSIDELVGRVPETAKANETPRGFTGSAAWPLPKIDESKVRALSDENRTSLQAAILIAAAQVGLDIKKNGEN